jgi:transcriptional regulator of acetoin/glycerol metabolism
MAEQAICRCSLARIVCFKWGNFHHNSTEVARDKVLFLGLRVTKVAITGNRLLGGARRKTTKKQDEGMRALWDSGKFTAAELAKQFGISVPTFFRRMRPKSLKKKD